MIKFKLKEKTTLWQVSQVQLSAHQLAGQLRSMATLFHPLPSIPFMHFSPISALFLAKLPMPTKCWPHASILDLHCTYIHCPIVLTSPCPIHKPQLESMTSVPLQLILYWRPQNARNRSI